MRKGHELIRLVLPVLKKLNVFDRYADLAFGTSLSGQGEFMEADKLITKLIKLQNQADAHSSEFIRLEYIKTERAKALFHYRQNQKMRSKIQTLIRKIATLECETREQPNSQEKPSPIETKSSSHSNYF